MTSIHYFLFFFFFFNVWASITIKWNCFSVFQILRKWYEHIQLQTVFMQKGIESEATMHWIILIESNKHKITWCPPRHSFNITVSYNSNLFEARKLATVSDSFGAYGLPLVLISTHCFFIMQHEAMTSAAIEVIGAVCKRLTWSKYLYYLKHFIHVLQTGIVEQKLSVRWGRVVWLIFIRFLQIRVTLVHCFHVQFAADYSGSLSLWPW